MFRISYKTNAILEFEKVVNMIMGVYTDATSGLHIFQSRLEELTKDRIPNARLFYSQGDPNDPTMEVEHVAPVSEVLLRNTEAGSNFKFIGNMCLISIYQYWEDCCRSKIAEFLNKEKKDLKEPIMGDIRLLRNSIIHHRAVAKKEVEECTLLNWYKEGEEIFIDTNQFREIIKHIRTYIEKLKSEHKKFMV